jgi:hypothetical protein
MQTLNTEFSNIKYRVYPIYIFYGLCYSTIQMFSSCYQIRPKMGEHRKEPPKRGILERSVFP